MADWIRAIEINKEKKEVLRNDLSIGEECDCTYNGAKLLSTSDGYYHVWKETFERIQAFNPDGTSSYWVVTKKDGTKWFFGYQATEHAANTCSRIQAAGEPGKIQIWSLSKVMDMRPVPTCLIQCCFGH